jgi:hypothetical protein
MTEKTPFHAEPDPELGRLLASHFEGPDPAGFLGRLEQRLRVLPERDTEWEVLARWARPGVLAAAMAAGFVLGLTWWREWSRPANPPPVSVAALEAPRGATGGPILYAVLEGR